MAIAQISTAAPPTIHYPESDGKPMADNTKQFRWIVTIEGGIDALFANRPDVFVAGDLLWYPVEGRPDIRAAPDVLVVFGRPKGDRGSYLQWKEDGIPPQVVFEILSPSNTVAEMTNKFEFYRLHGVQEYYLYDPDRNEFYGWLRHDDTLEAIPVQGTWVSPLLGIRFELKEDDLYIYRPDGERFKTFVELIENAQQERARAEEERTRAEQERARAEEERTRAERLAAQLRSLGIEPEK
ncbi:MAG TPA: Uma2 family endonuclease [Anaerolineae bacterium]|nr:Uma2 family endonuclease [Anaerolineae bacterium]